MKYKCDDCGQPTDNICEFDIGENHYITHLCDDCSDRMDKMEEWKNEKFQTETMICPWCEYEFIAEDNIYEEGEGTCNCPCCDKELEYECKHSISWTTRKPEELYEEEEQE